MKVNSTFDFLACAKAIEDWDLVSLRDACQLPAEIPLDALADLVARVSHVERRTPRAFDRAIETSRALPWLQASGRLVEVRGILPAVYVYLNARSPASNA